MLKLRISMMMVYICRFLAVDAVISPGG